MNVVPLVAILGRTSMRREVVRQLCVGSIIPLDQKDGEPLELLVGDRLLGRGEIVIVEGVYGLKVTELDAESGASAGPPDNEDEIVTMTAIFGTTVVFPAEVSEIKVGGIILLSQRDGEPVDVHADGALVARGEVVVIEGSYGVKVTIKNPRRFGKGRTG
jgi:flagellar motor switch/type III secretory pathway protein FliN